LKTNSGKKYKPYLIVISIESDPFALDYATDVSLGENNTFALVIKAFVLQPVKQKERGPD